MPELEPLADREIVSALRHALGRLKRKPHAFTLFVTLLVNARGELFCDHEARCFRWVGVETNISYSELATKTGLGLSSIPGLIKELKDVGAITLKAKGRGRNHPASYRLRLDF